MPKTVISNCKFCQHRVMCEALVPKEVRAALTTPGACAFYDSMMPFAIGDLVYTRGRKYNRETKQWEFSGAEENRVSSMTQKADGTWKIRITTPSRYVVEYKDSEIGTVIFRTAEEVIENHKKGEKECPVIEI